MASSRLPGQPQKDQLNETLLRDVAEFRAPVERLAEKTPSVAKLLAYEEEIESRHVMGVILLLHQAIDELADDNEKEHWTRDRRLPKRFRKPDSPPRSLNAFATRADKLAMQAHDLFGYELPEVRALAAVAREFASFYACYPRNLRESRIRQGPGRDLSPETPLAEVLDFIFEDIPPTPRRTWIGELLSEWFGTLNTDPEQIRSRIRDYRTHLEARDPTPPEPGSEAAAEFAAEFEADLRKAGVDERMVGALRSLGYPYPGCR